VEVHPKVSKIVRVDFAKLDSMTFLDVQGGEKEKWSG
jgi:hypothetical protein